MIYAITVKTKAGKVRTVPGVANNPDDAIFDALAARRISIEDRVTRCVERSKGNGSAPVCCGGKK